MIIVVMGVSRSGKATEGWCLLFLPCESCRGVKVLCDELSDSFYLSIGGAGSFLRQHPVAAQRQIKWSPEK